MQSSVFAHLDDMNDDVYSATFSTSLMKIIAMAMDDNTQIVSDAIKDICKADVDQHVDTPEDIQILKILFDRIRTRGWDIQYDVQDGYIVRASVNVPELPTP
jgi:hypothetical protein